MTVQFKKGDQVYMVSSWGNDGRVRIQSAKIHSCGKKVMKLENVERSISCIDQVRYKPSGDGLNMFNAYLIVRENPMEAAQKIADRYNSALTIVEV